MGGVRCSGNVHANAERVGLCARSLRCALLLGCWHGANGTERVFGGSLEHSEYAGTNPETFRFYEALEAGAIPLMPRADWEVAYSNLGEPPFPLLNGWCALLVASMPTSHV